MPSGPPELHARWKNDGNAIAFLEAAGYKLTRDWQWIPPSYDRIITEDEASALDYLVLEWDFGDIAPRP